MCILDYRFNPHNDKILKECKKVEERIVSTLDIYYEKTPYLNFYKKYIQ